MVFKEIVCISSDLNKLLMWKNTLQNFSKTTLKFYKTTDSNSLLPDLLNSSLLFVDEDSVAFLDTFLLETSKIVVLKSDPKTNFLSLIRKHTLGLISEPLKADILQEAVKVIENGSFFMSQELIDKYASELKNKKEDERETEFRTVLNQLKNNELKILEFLIMGFSYEEIAQRTFLTVDGVRYHIRKIYKVFAVNSRSDLIIKSVNLGWKLENQN